MGTRGLVELKSLNKTYGQGRAAVTALELDCFQVLQGDFLAFTGPSGCGKTTLLNLVGLLDRPTTGEIAFVGVNVVRWSERALSRLRRDKIGFVFQNYHLLPHLDALQNVLVPTYPARCSFNPVKRAKELLGMVGLDGKERRRPGELSGGEQQRVAIARALIMDPEIILADEPTGNLDSATGAEVIRLLQALNEQGKTIMVATHDARVAAACRRQIRMIDGRIVADTH